ncbi:MAG: hypothetical protein SVT52_07685 [Planctomycetota bacterium]|nr:hypothetical protein [Planctomycetota bacterium]
MRRLILLILLVAAFLGGYHLGRRPNSPDIFARANSLSDKAQQAGQRLAVMIQADDNGNGSVNR